MHVSSPFLVSFNDQPSGRSQAGPLTRHGQGTRLPETSKCRSPAARRFLLEKVGRSSPTRLLQGTTTAHGAYHHATAQTGAVTLIQRFGSALNLNIHFHMLFLDGVYVTTSDRLTFRRVPPPTVEALEKLVRGISKRIGRELERQGLLVRDLGG